MSPSKSRVRDAFERAAASYDGAAEVQRRACERLAARLPPGLAPVTVVDAGCGTGYGLRLLTERFPAARLIGLDIAPAMVARLRAGSERLVGDAERLPLADACLDLYWSSLTLQWCDPVAALGEAARALRPGGTLAAATLGPGTFAELRTAFARVDRYAHTLAFRDPDDLAALARAAGLRDLRVTRETALAHHPDLKSLMRAVKAVGANQLGAGRRRGLMGRAAFARAEAAYEAAREPAGLPLTYDLVYLVGRR